MSRRCMRPGCDRQAVARLTYDPVRCELWLDPLPNHAAPVQELCAFHVERLTVPRGWTVEDRRPDAARVPRPEVLDVVPEPLPEPVPESEPEQVREQAADPEPVAAAVEREGSAPRGRRSGRGDSPLLERAFAWTGPQRSILTQPRTDDEAAQE